MSICKIKQVGQEQLLRVSLLPVKWFPASLDSILEPKSSSPRSSRASVSSWKKSWNQDGWFAIKTYSQTDKTDIGCGEEEEEQLQDEEASDTKVPANDFERDGWRGQLQLCWQPRQRHEPGHAPPVHGPMHGIIKRQLSN